MRLKSELYKKEQEEIVVNGATNIYKIAYNAINNKERPNYLSRSNKLSGSLDELPKPKFTCSVRSKPF